MVDLPWIITFGPLDDEEWEPVVCGPYERPHALALAEHLVADDDLMAVVEPLLPRVSVEEIRGEIAAARLAAEEDGEDDDDMNDDLEDDIEYEDLEEEDDEYDDDLEDDDEDEDDDLEAGEDFDEEAAAGSVGQPALSAAPPSADEVRAGLSRIAAQLARPA